MDNKTSIWSKVSNIFKKKKNPLPIETLFTLPSPLPSWPKGNGFAGGTIDLGGLQVRQVSKFAKVWAAREGGSDNLGATFYEPSPVPDGFFILGHYSQSNSKPLSGWVLVGRDADNSSLSPPTDYTLVWSSEGSSIKQDGVCYIWLPIPPTGYKPVGLIVTLSSEKPGVDRIRCVRSDLTDVNENEALTWGLGEELNVYSSRPRNRGVEAMGVLTGTFVVRRNGVDLELPCLKNASDDSKTSMPNEEQIKAITAAYSPIVYFHPNEEYLPSSVKWYFENGALLYKKGEEGNPVRIDQTGSNLPQGGENDESYWIDLPTDNAAKEKVKRGDLENAYGYLHVKPMFGATFTDVAVWLFYPFNGPARAKVGIFDVPLGKIGEHVGDWEHVTLRISNFNGEMKSVYFSQHSKGVWVEVSELEFGSGNKPAVYSSLHGHAFYAKAGLELQGNGSIGIRNDSGKGKFFDVGERVLVVSDAEPAWVNYRRKWGPKISYNTEDELRKVGRFLPGKLRSEFEKVVRGLPNEVFGEDGPTGPKLKDNWSGDERS